MIDIDRIAKLLGIPTWDEFSKDFDYHDAWHYAFQEASREVLANGGTNEEASDAGHEAGQAAEQEAEGEAFKNYYDALMHVAEKLFAEHHLSLVPVTGPAPRSLKINFDTDDDTGLSGLPRWVRQPRRRL